VMVLVVVLGKMLAQFGKVQKQYQKMTMGESAFWSLKKAIGSTVAIDAKVDPGLLGGLVIKIGSRMVDSSIRTKLTQLRLSMKGIG